MNTKELTKEHVESLVCDVCYEAIGCTITCYLMVGDATVVGNSYCFDMDNQNVDMGKKSAYEDAMRQLWHLEAYHFKRLRGEV